MRTRAWSALVVVAAAVACGDPLALGEMRELAAAQRRWQDGTTYYAYEVRVGCFCPPELNGWSLVTVENDIVISVVPRDAAVVIPPARFAMWPTVTELFASVAREAGGAGRVTATYDERLGYPLTVEIQAPPGVTDGGVFYETRNLVSLIAGHVPP